MRISLCVICGNEAGIIERFLYSFAPAFDELSLCRAIGAQTPDATVDLARDWCAKNGKDFRFSEHVNGRGATEWPHVDDFAAARNKSFDNGTGDWLFWADCDDMLHEPHVLRAVLAKEGIGDLIRFRYDVVGTNKMPTRERAIRRAVFQNGNRWQFAIHENLTVRPGTQISDFDLPVWVHQPKIQSNDNRKRNKRILAQTLQHAAANYFYVHQEWYCEGNQANTERFGNLALAFPDLDGSFRYEANLNLARITRDNEKALRYTLDAHAVFPWCREAMGLAALLFIERNDAARALHWAELLYRTPVPDEGRRPWTHEPKWYGWAGTDLLARCQRFAGQEAAAKATQATLGEPIFSLIHATRGRAPQAADCRNNWLNLAEKPEAVEHILCVDADDAPTLKLAKQYQHTISPLKTCVAAWNQGAAASRGKILIQVSDDWAPIPGWDSKILAEMAGAGKSLDDEWVLAIHDGHREDDLLCMAILSRARYERQGFMFSPEYESVYSDNEFSLRAFSDGVVIDARKRLTFHHLHPAFNAGKWDATYQHSNAPERYTRGKEIFERRNPSAVKA